MTSSRPSALKELLFDFPNDAGIHLISRSNKSFGDGDSDEEAYSRQFDVDEDYINCVCAGLTSILKRVDADTAHPALEIGCGTGVFSSALARSNIFPECLITDASRKFLHMTRDRITQTNRLAMDDERVQFALLPDEGLHLLPAESFSLIAARYVLHHILDWQSFIGVAAKLLRPNGVLTFEEPCREGFILQAILVSFLPTLMESKRRSDGSASNPDFDRVIAKQIKDFVDTIVWYARRDVDKSQHEDKHLFRVSEIMAVGHKNGLEVEYYPNAGYDTVAFEHSEISFEHELFHNLRVNFGFGNGIVEILKEHMSSYLQMIQSISPNGGSPYVKGVFSCKRIA
jgi:ubiquinone/menaquinone biosynthesis C-methylase UbiE